MGPAPAGAAGSGAAEEQGPAAAAGATSEDTAPPDQPVDGGAPPAAAADATDPSPPAPAASVEEGTAGAPVEPGGGGGGGAGAPQEATPAAAAAADVATGGSGPSSSSAGAAPAPEPPAPPAETAAPSQDAAKPRVALSAGAPEFVPGGLAPPLPGIDESDIFARLPLTHRQYLRQYYQAHTGEWVAYYVGRLKSYNTRSGYGFLECAQSKIDFGCDVFIHKNFVRTPFHIGQPVEFAVALNTKGQPQAIDVNWLPPLPTVPQATVRALASGGMGAGAFAPHPAPAAAASAAAAVAAAGAAATPAAPNGAGPPAAPAAGRAAQVTQAPPSVAATPASGAAATPASASTASADAPAAVTTAAATAAPAVQKAVILPEPRRLGTLKSYSQAQGYGFIVCEEVHQRYQRDTYFEKSSLNPNGGWEIGQHVEFSLALNGNLPQARHIEWNPIPYQPEPPDPQGQAGTNGSGAAGSKPRTAKTVNKVTEDRLKKLLRYLHDGQKETAVVMAIDLQGGSGSSQQTSGDQDVVERHVDYVSFVLDRLGPEREAAAVIKDFLKMLLLLMLAKMVRSEQRLQRSQVLIRWFKVLAETIDQTADTVPEHFQDVVAQIDSNLQSAMKESACLKDEALSKELQAAFAVLEAKRESARKA